MGTSKILMEIALVGEPILRQAARQVSHDEIASEQFTTFLRQLIDTMQQANGIGIAAPQVFDPRAVMVIASRPSERYPTAPQMEPQVLINPVIVRCSDTNVKDWEGCLSVPGLRGYISRSEWVEIRYLDITGAHCQWRIEGFIARIFQHELDHLIGKTWLDHVTSSSDIIANEVWARMQR